MRIAMGSDRAGLALKEAEKVFLTAQHRDILDHDTHSADPLDYSDYAEAMYLVARKKPGDHLLAITQSAQSATHERPRRS
jgi:ribose 5-phosphate isomerase RpiB